MVKLLIAAMLLTAACGGPVFDPDTLVGTWQGRTGVADEHLSSGLDSVAHIVANGDGTFLLAGVCADGDGPTIAKVDGEMRIEPFDCQPVVLPMNCNSVSLSDFGLRNCYGTHIEGGRAVIDTAGSLIITMSGTRSSCEETYPYKLWFGGKKS